jgi:type IV secretory pathway VirB6-like protein
MRRKALKRFVFAIAASAICGVALAQVGTTIKEGAKATAEKAQEIGDRVKAAVEPEPKKAADKAKAEAHKAKARHHAGVAKDAAKEIPK